MSDLEKRREELDREWAAFYERKQQFHKEDELIRLFFIGASVGTFLAFFVLCAIVAALQ